MANRGRPPYRKERQTLENKQHDEDESRSRINLNRDTDRLAREVDTRIRDDIYDLPEVDAFNPATHAQKLQLLAPPPRIDERHGKLRQHWVAHKLNNGHRVQTLLDKGYRIRHPNTVPPAFRNFTESWNGHDVIMVAGDHILMETSETNWRKIQQAKIDENRENMRSIKEKHGEVIRDGEVQSFKDAGAGHFIQDIVVQNNANSEGDVSFAD